MRKYSAISDGGAAYPPSLNGGVSVVTCMLWQCVAAAQWRNVVMAVWRRPCASQTYGLNGAVLGVKLNACNLGSVAYNVSHAMRRIVWLSQW